MDPSISTFKKDYLESAIQRYETWISTKKLRMKAIEEELWIEAAIVEKMGESMKNAKKGRNYPFNVKHCF